MKLNCLNALLSIVIVSFGAAFGFTQTKSKRFELQSVFPDGKQTQFISLTNPNGVNTEQYEFPYNYETVLVAVERAAADLERIGKRPMVARRDRGIVVNSNLEYAKEKRIGLIPVTWVDEIATEVTELDRNNTKVSVRRKVHELRNDRRGGSAWHLGYSNGKLEWWMLTKIRDYLMSGPAPRREPRPSEPPKEDSEQYIMSAESNFLRFDLKRCRASGSSIVCELDVTNTEADGPSSEARILILSGQGSKFWDASGGEYRSSKTAVGRAPLPRARTGLVNENTGSAALVSTAVAPARIEFQNVPTDLTQMSLFEIGAQVDRQRFSVKFRNVPLR